MTPVTFIMTLWHVDVIVPVYDVWPWRLRVNLFVQRWSKINWTTTDKKRKMFFFEISTFKFYNIIQLKVFELVSCLHSIAKVCIVGFFCWLFTSDHCQIVKIGVFFY